MDICARSSRHQKQEICISAINFRPFDERQSIYCDYSGGFIGITREDNEHLLGKKNLAILFPRQAITAKYGYFVTDKICDINFTGTAGQYGAGLVFPLYLYPEIGGQMSIEGSEKRIPNLDKDILGRIASGLGLTFTPEKENDDGTFAPIDIPDYIYATSTRNYREGYKEFLKIDFPRTLSRQR